MADDMRLCSPEKLAALTRARLLTSKASRLHNRNTIDTMRGPCKLILSRADIRSA